MSDPDGPIGTGEQQPPVPPARPVDWQQTWAGPDPSTMTGNTMYGGVAARPSRQQPKLVAGAAALLVGGLIAGVGIGHGVWRPGLNLVNRVTATATGGAAKSGSATGFGATNPGSVTDAIVDINTDLQYQGARAAGTGIVLTSNGEVLTNNHVINGATTISVTDVGNGQTYSGTVVGYDRTQDLAVLRLQGASGLTTAPFGDSAKVTVGDAVVGIGNAGGTGGDPSKAPGSVISLEQTITASDEDGSDPEQLDGLIHVDAAIQPGDSGGPLVNSSGQVVGIDTAASSSPSVEPASTAGGGDGYAIPINHALSIAGQIEAGKASSTVHLGETAFLGVQIGAGGSDNGFGAPTVGAEVDGVVPDTAADQAGLATGDVITSVNGTSIDSPTALSSAMAGLHPGDKVTVEWTDQTGATQTATGSLTAGPAA